MQSGKETCCFLRANFGDVEDVLKMSLGLQALVFVRDTILGTQRLRKGDFHEKAQTLSFDGAFGALCRDACYGVGGRDSPADGGWLG